MGRTRVNDELVPDINNQEMWDEVNSVLDRSMDSSNDFPFDERMPDDDFLGMEHTGRRGTAAEVVLDHNANVMGFGAMNSGKPSGIVGPNLSAFGIETPRVEDLFDQDQLAALAAFPAAALTQLREVEIASAMNERKSAQGKQTYSSPNDGFEKPVN